jgi:ATP-dependent Clp protease, protease subunit
MTTKNSCDGSSSFVTTNEDVREIYFFGEVNDSSVAQIIYGLRILDAQKQANIGLIMSSVGGDVMGGWAIYDALRNLRSKVIGQCYGECASIATLILQGCDTRLLSEHSVMFFHDYSLSLEGTSRKEVLPLLKDTEIMHNKYLQVLQEASVLTLKEIQKLCAKDSYIYADVAVGYGLTDGILGQTKKKKVKK